MPPCEAAEPAPRAANWCRRSVETWPPTASRLQDAGGRGEPDSRRAPPDLVFAHAESSRSSDGAEGTGAPPGAGGGVASPGCRRQSLDVTTGTGFQDQLSRSRSAARGHVFKPPWLTPHRQNGPTRLPARPVRRVDRSPGTGRGACGREARAPLRPPRRPRQARARSSHWGAVVGLPLESPPASPPLLPNAQSA